MRGIKREFSTTNLLVLLFRKLPKLNQQSLIIKSLWFLSFDILVMYFNLFLFLILS